MIRLVVQKTVNHAIAQTSSEIPEWLHGMQKAQGEGATWFNHPHIHPRIAAYETAVQ